MGRVVMPKEPMRGLKPERLCKLFLVPGIPALSLQGFLGVVMVAQGRSQEERSLASPSPENLVWRQAADSLRTLAFEKTAEVGRLQSVPYPFSLQKPIDK